jgi:gamma-glutamylcyclotransferase (GGCT)/AIG2-like uncharacterized protein YtfP
MVEAVQYVFVYGLLRSDVGGPMQPALATGARLIGRATWRGRLYRVAEFPGGVPSDGDEFVAGELYELGEGAGALLAQLDAYEAVPDDYVRVSSPVACAGREYAAWVYVWNRPTDGLERIESGDFAKR